MNGTYHYHNYSPCLNDKRDQPNQHSSLMGYALDGFGIFGLYGEDGAILNNQKLDECHGHTHAVYWNGLLQTIYHYHFTREYPYSVGCFRGQTTSRGQGQGQRAFQGEKNNGRGDQQGFQRPDQQMMQHQPPNLARAAAELGVSAEALRNALGPPPPPNTRPDFSGAAERLGIDERRLGEAMRHAIEN